MKNQKPMEVNVYCGEQEKILVPAINDWIIEHFVSFPFLYVNQGELLANHIFFEDPNGFAIIAEREAKKLGMLLAIPLNSPLLDVKYNPYGIIDQIEEKGFDSSQILYGAVFIVTNEERRNRDLILRIYQKAVNLAKKMGKKHICYFTTIREDNHPLKPASYVSPEPWEELNPPPRSMGVTFELSWPTLQIDGSIKESANLQELFILDIS